MKTHHGSLTRTGVALLLSTAPLFALDQNGNRQCDVWEARYHAVGLVADADADSDGYTNEAEALAGTDPLSGNSFPAVELIREGTGLKAKIVSQPGKRYRLLSSASPGGPWSPTGTAVIATTTYLEFTAPLGPTVGFFKVATEDVDSDNDGLTDWSELQLAGFDRLSASSFGAGSDDLAAATAMLQTLRDGAVAVSADASVAYEKDASPASLTFTRPAAANYPFTIFLKPAKPTDPTKSSATAEDYSLKDGSGQAVTNRLVIPAGQTSATLSVVPVADAKIEVPEQLRILFGGTNQVVNVTISDARNTLENQRLLVAYLHPLQGVISVGSGIATVRLQGDNDLATVTVSFSNLTSAANSTQVLNSASSILQSVPPANYGGQTWAIRASQSFTTDQAVLDALLSGGVKLGVFTQDNVNGEIEGPFQATSGSSQFQTPPLPDPIAGLTGTELDRDIVRFLTQATFGPTPEAIADLKARVTASNGDRIAAYRQWIRDQFALPSPSLLEYTTAANRQEIEYRAALPTTDPNYNAAYDPNNSNRRRGWWMFALSSPAQLRERYALALSEIFVISDTNSLVYERTYGSAHYYDMLRTGSSGSYRSLLEGVSTHPMMGYYLSHLRNQKAVLDRNGVVLVSPDENYAREIMQLFSIGLVQLHPDGSLKLGGNGLPIATYNQTDITEMARVFTGWSFRQYNNPSTSATVVPNVKFNQGNGSERFESQWTSPMLMFPAYHDVAAKSALGLNLPAAQTGEKDLADVLDFLAVHPNTAPFICRRLIQRFTSANPSAGYLYRVSTVFKNSNGNFADTIEAILLDPEARSIAFALDQASAGKTREPLLRVTAFLRALGGKSQLPLSDLSTYGYPPEELAKFPAGTMRARISSTSTNLFQTQLSAPTVFNFFSPDYSPAGLLAANGVNSPELQLANENSVIQAGNYLYSPIYGTLAATNLLDQALPPYNYSTSAQNLAIDIAPLTALYLGVVDKDKDGIANGIFDKFDVGAFNKPAELRKACEAVLDRVDFLLCAGELKARYGDTVGQPRQIILDAALSIRTSNNNSTDQTTVTRDRIRTILWLVMSSPECVIQK